MPRQLLQDFLDERGAPLVAPAPDEDAFVSGLELGLHLAA